MRKTMLSALIAGAFTMGGSAQAALTFDLNGPSFGPSFVISVDAFDWAQTSFLAKNGNQAIANFETNAFCAANPGLCAPDFVPLSTKFEVLTHAKLSAYIDATTGQSTSLPGTELARGEITLVGKFEETVTSVIGTEAKFATTGEGWMEMFHSTVADSVALTGANYDNGNLIMRAVGVGASTGGFEVTNLTPVQFDQAFANNDANNQYRGQLSVSGRGDQEQITFGSTSIALDGDYFKTALPAFSILFNNISINLPFTSVNPSDCFNPDQASPTDLAVTAGGAANATTQCLNNHANGAPLAGAGGKYSDQASDNGYLPVTGDVVGLVVAEFEAGPDFVAQTDYNSVVTGAAPEPGTLALLGLALGALGITSTRRRV